MDIRMYEYPLTIFQEGSLSQAAKKLGISQSALSHSLTALENELGYPLFNRSTRRIEPTASGHIFLDTASQIVSVKRQTYHSIRLLQESYSKRLLVGTTPHNGAQIYSYLYKAFYSLYPHIALVQKEGYQPVLKEALLKKEIDLLIGSCSDFSDSGYRFLRFARQEVLLAISESHPLAAKATPLYGTPVSISLKELEDMPFLLPGPGASYTQTLLQELERQKLSPTIVFRSENLPLIRDMTMLGLGVSFLPATHVYARPGLRYFSIDPPLWIFPGVFYHNERHLTEDEQHLIYLCYQQTRLHRVQPHFIIDPNYAAQAIISQYEKGE